MKNERTEKLNLLIEKLQDVYSWLANDDYLNTDYTKIDKQITHIQNATNELVRIYFMPPVDGTTRSHAIEDDN